jgi:hypothetical protein
VESDRCKDFICAPDCKYFPEGCDTCKDRFACYTKDEVYRSRITGIFYKCTKCPAVKIDALFYKWVETKLSDIVDIRHSTFKPLDKKIADELHKYWLDKENEK